MVGASKEHTQLYDFAWVQSHRWDDHWEATDTNTNGEGTYTSSACLEFKTYSSFMPKTYNKNHTQFTTHMHFLMLTNITHDNQKITTINVSIRKIKKTKF